MAAYPLCGSITVIRLPCSPRNGGKSPRSRTASGSGSGEIAATAGVDLPLAHRITQMIATEPCQRFIVHLVYHSEERLTLKQGANGNVLIGGG